MKSHSVYMNWHMRRSKHNARGGGFLNDQELYNYNTISIGCLKTMTADAERWLSTAKRSPHEGKPFARQ